MPMFRNTYNEINNILEAHSLRGMDDYQLEEFANVIYKQLQEIGSQRQVVLVEGHAKEGRFNFKCDFIVEVSRGKKGAKILTEQINGELRELLESSINSKNLVLEENEDTWECRLNINSRSRAQFIFEKEGKIVKQKEYQLNDELYNILIMHEEIENKLDTIELVFVYYIKDEKEFTNFEQPAAQPAKKKFGFLKSK